MGYTTDFRGEFKLDRPLTDAHFDYLVKFNETRRMNRDSEIAAQLEDPIRIAAGLPIGANGEYFVGGFGFFGQEDDASVINHNNSAPSQPGLWCKWAPNEEGTAIIWDGAEKFYSYVEWIEYLIDHFLKPWGYKLNGKVHWRGEVWEDSGTIVITDNIVNVE